MLSTVDTSVPRRHLARELRRLRQEQARMSLEEAAQQLRWTRATVERLEWGDLPPRPRDVATLCALYRADEHVTACLVAIATHTQSGVRWQNHHTPQPPQPTEIYRQLREHADRILEYQPTVVPTMLQTSAYAIIHLAGTFTDPDQLERRVSAQRDDARLLTRTEPEPPQLTAVLDEAVLRQFPHRPDIMAEQLRHLAQLGELPNVRIRIVPFTAAPHPALLMDRGFTVLDFPEHHQQDALTPPGFTEAGHLDDNAESRRYRAAFDDLLTLALGEDATRELLLGTAERYQR